MNVQRADDGKHPDGAAHLLLSSAGGEEGDGAGGGGMKQWGRRRWARRVGGRRGYSEMLFLTFKRPTDIQKGRFLSLLKDCRLPVK